MREQVEVLEHHTDVAPHLFDVLEVVVQLDATDDDRALLVHFEPVMHRSSVDLPEPERPQMTMRSPRATA
jgi:hypothetical protein